MVRIGLLVILLWHPFSYGYQQDLIPLGGHWERGEESYFVHPSYQIGDLWGKKKVDAKTLEEGTPYHRASFATARLGGGTSFYLGKFAGKHMMATNHHVCPRMTSCIGKVVHFTLFGWKFKVVKSLGSWQSVDLSLVAIDVGDEDKELALAKVGRNFAFSEALYLGQPLITVGYGSANNYFRRLVANQDSDCKVFSGTEEFRFLSDPDRKNPGSYQVWSFANGCDVSHGDSGSALVDRETGDVVGIIWTGKIPKDPKIRDREYVDDIFESGSDEIWTELSYGVPVAKIKERLERTLIGSKLSEEDRTVLQAILNGHS